jgi:hypothetical protein
MVPIRYIDVCTQLTAMVSYGTGIQLESVPCPHTIHPAWCIGVCCFTLATENLELLMIPLLHDNSRKLNSLQRRLAQFVSLFVVDYNHRELAQLKPFTFDLGIRPIRKNFERSFKERYASGDWSRFRNLMFALWFTLLGGSFVFFDIGPSILFLIFAYFWWCFGSFMVAGIHHLKMQHNKHHR